MHTSLLGYCLLVAKHKTNEMQAKAIYCQIVQIYITLHCQVTETSCIWALGSENKGYKYDWIFVFIWELKG